MAATVTDILDRARAGLRLVLPEAVRDWINSRWLVRWSRLRWRNSRVLRPTLNRQLAWAGTPAAIAPTDARILVPLIETSHYQFYQILVLAKALQLRGAAVRVLICDSVLDGCELKNSRRRDADQCLNCRTNARDLVGLFGLEAVRLSELVTDGQTRDLRALAAAVAKDYPATYEYKGVEVIGMTNESVTRHYYGAVPVDGSPELEVQRRRHLYSALVGVEIAERSHGEWAPTALMNSMGVYADWAPYAHFFKQRGIPYHLVSMAPFDLKAVMLNYEDLYAGTERFELWRDTRETPWLDEHEHKVLNEKVSERFTVGGEFERKYDWFASDAEEFKRRIDADKRNVFLFSNLFWDVGINYTGNLFSDVIPWVQHTVEVLADQPDCHLYVKPHPEESYGPAHSGYTVEDVIRERFQGLPANVTIIPPELKLRTYDLFPLIDLGVVYNGTVGLEMMLEGIPVVAAGAAPYGGHGLSFEPRTAAEYEDALLGRKVPPPPDARLVELFAYFYFVKTQLPWHLTQSVYFDHFKGFTFNSLEHLLPGRDLHLDHLCSCILDPKNNVIEAWPGTEVPAS